MTLALQVRDQACLIKEIHVNHLNRARYGVLSTS
jgi:hypothetical protein